MSDLLEKLRPSRIKREILPIVIISIITISSFVYFSYQDSSGSITYSPDVPQINIEVPSEIINSSQQCFIKLSFDDFTAGIFPSSNSHE